MVKNVVAPHPALLKLNLHTAVKGTNNYITLEEVEMQQNYPRGEVLTEAA